MTVSRTTFLALLVSMATTAFADCDGRTFGLDSDKERPLFVAKSCTSARKFVVDKTSSFEVHETYEAVLEQTDSKDLAIEVVPLNQNASSFMGERQREFFHYKGSCQDVPLDEPVRLVTLEHCSDTGLTLFLMLGDVSILEFVAQE